MARPLFLRYRLLPVRGWVGRVGVALVGGLLLVGGGAAAASAAEPYGELTHFGSAGIGKGQFHIPSEKAETHAFGVDPTDNTLYVGDEPTEGEYRVQKLGPKGEFIASVSFKPANPIALEGIAVDPAKERIYVLAVALRSESASIDPATRAAGTLYAFKTKASGEKLESAVSGASLEAKEGVLANPVTLETESETQGHALLEPSGIATDPTTHDVIIMGLEDRGASQMRVALQRVSETGGTGARYVDTTDCFGGQGSAECEEGGAKQPNSPVVTQGGKVYAESFDQIWEIPSDFTSSQPPKLFIPFISFAEPQTGPVQELVEFPGAPVPGAGGGLALAPEGTIYAYANIKHNSPAKIGEYKYPGALLFTAAGAETGWTGGQSKASGGGKCTISFFQSASLAAGKEGDLFVLNPAAPDVVELGPGGTGCPAARASVPSMMAKGQAVTQVPAGTKVTLSSTVEQGNALSTAWNFGDGESETVNTDELQTTKVTHTFTQPGFHTITETIHTDDLQTPEITVTGKLQVEGEEIKEAVKITAQPAAQAVEEGTAAAFTASASGIPAPSVQWQVSTNGGATWASVVGATSTTLNTGPTTASENGYEYRAVFTNSSGSAPTEPATLTVIREAVKITAQPIAEIVEEGANATFTASASGIPAPSVQWEVSTNGGTTWTNDTADAGNATGTLTVASTTAAENGNQYRAVFTNSSGAVDSEPATLTVKAKGVTEAVKITTQPVAQAVEEGTAAAFTASASGIPAPTVQWQLSTNGGASWANDTADAGNTTDTLSVAGTTMSENGYEYRAVFTNSSGSLETEPATLTVIKEAVKITAQPVAQAVEEGTSATFTASASGIPAPTVQWQVSTNGGLSWASDTADAGNTTDTLLVAGTTVAENAYEYRAVFTNSSGSLGSEAATLTVKAEGAKGSAVSITTQPKGLEVREGETATFTASASGAPRPTVQWQVSANGGASWANDTTDPGHAASLLKVAGTTLAESGHEYRAVFTNPTDSKETEPAKLMVKEKAQGPLKAKETLTPKETLLVPALPGGSGVLGELVHGPAPVPNARLQSASLKVAPSGALVLAVTCPAGESSCMGTVALRTLGAVSVAAGRKSKKKKSKTAVLQLASGAFTVAGGQIATVTLHLSAKARALLTSTRMLLAQATITAHDPAGATYVSQTPVVLRTPVSKAKHHHP